MSFNEIGEKAAEILTVKSAVAHWRYQRLTAVALVPLSIWLLLLLNKALHAPYAETLDWLAAPLNTFAILAWTVAVIYHAALGVQVVLEDYISSLTCRHTAIRASNLAFLSIGIVALISIILIFSR
ncbi:succinate dehydrogenase, hydrophobic membrane anchor protein [Methylomonas sp. AM2-LC]|uniref:succinate dehydrogenase, hydrophobic membrane anchor protein n=1 Tax=Methylomonas sp. AM2-LC TaxID=3153301 RepID=UPI003263BC4F